MWVWAFNCIIWGALIGRGLRLCEKFLGGRLRAGGRPDRGWFGSKISGHGPGMMCSRIKNTCSKIFGLGTGPQRARLGQFVPKVDMIVS